MKCYNHPDKDGVAICRACGKALCRECGQETGNGFACQQRCATNLSEVQELHTRQAQHLRNMKRMNFLGFFFSIGMGLLFIYFSFMGYGIVYDLILLLGIGFTGYGVIAVLINIVIFIFDKNKTVKK